jgi:hypothetical protein
MQGMKSGLLLLLPPLALAGNQWNVTLCLMFALLVLHFEGGVSVRDTGGRGASGVVTCLEQAIRARRARA